MYLPIQVGISPTLNIRGIIAAEDIKKGQIIERCPIVLIPIQQDSILKETVFNNYTFEWNKTYSAFVLGYGSLYNHSYTPNARYNMNYPHKQIVFTAIKDIAKGEEIFVNYNYEPTSKDPLDTYLLSLDTTYNTKQRGK